MKVVCESCQAKYQVPDERVAGKKLKIRCKRCGATVLIRGDLTQTGLSDGSQPLADAPHIHGAHGHSAMPAAELEWHASIDGQSYGPFDTSSLLRWLDEQPGGWDAHVWRDGFTDWVEVRACPELMAAAPAMAPIPQDAQGYGYDEAAAAAYGGQDGDASAHEQEEQEEQEEEEGPTRTFSSDDVGPRRSKTLSGTQAPDDFRARGSSIRTRSSPALAAVPAAAMGGGWSPAAAASPRVTAAQAMTGERHEDSVLFSTSSLQQVAMTNSQPNYGSNNPGFASGEASGLIDIRALASLARQTTPQIAPGAAYDRFRADDDSRLAVMNQTGAFNRVDSLAPVSTTSTSSSAAVPLAILGGFALVAAAAFAAILITREVKGPETAGTVVPDTSSTSGLTATGAQPTVTQELSPTAAPSQPAAAEPEVEDKSASPAAADESSDELASGKAAKRPRGARTASEGGEEKKTVPADKAKPKKEEKSSPPSLDEVMLADKPKEKEKPEPEAKHEPAKASSAGSDIDDLLGGGTGKAAAKTPSKSRSIDDLLDTAVDGKKKAGAAPEPTPAPAAAAAPDEADDLPPSPTRDEVLAAMRGVESAVRACNSANTKGTAEVQITVTGSTGRVTNATVTGLTGEVGSCIARAARNAKFGKFSRPTFQVKYPYRFQ